MHQRSNAARRTQTHRYAHSVVGQLWGVATCLCLLACADSSMTTASNMGDDAALPESVIADMTIVEAVDSMIQTDGFVWPQTPTQPGRSSCVPLPTPIVLAHGFLGAGDTWSPHRRRFTANGFCGDRIHPFDWNSLDRNADHVSALSTFIDGIRARHQVQQVDLVGHSAGGGLGYEYLEDESRAESVRRIAARAGWAKQNVEVERLFHAVAYLT